MVWMRLRAERAPALLPQHRAYLARKAGELAARVDGLRLASLGPAPQVDALDLLAEMAQASDAHAARSARFWSSARSRRATTSLGRLPRSRANPAMRSLCGCAPRLRSSTS